MAWYNYIIWYMAINCGTLALLIYYNRKKRPQKAEKMGREFIKMEESWPYGKTSHMAFFLTVASLVTIPTGIAVTIRKLIKGGK